MSAPHVMKASTSMKDSAKPAQRSRVVSTVMLTVATPASKGISCRAKSVESATRNSRTARAALPMPAKNAKSSFTLQMMVARTAQRLCRPASPARVQVTVLAV